MSLTFFIHLPMKMEPIRSSETSAIKTQTPGNYPKRNILHYFSVCSLFMLRNTPHRPKAASLLIFAYLSQSHTHGRIPLNE